MRERIVSAGTALLLVSAVAIVCSAPSVADVSAGGPPPPRYQVTEDGGLLVDGDQEMIPCGVDFGSDPAADFDLDPGADPAILAELERKTPERDEACREAGLPVSPPPGPADAPIGSVTQDAPVGSTAPPSESPDGGAVLPRTGGAALLTVLAGGLLLAGSAFLRVAARSKTG